MTLPLPGCFCPQCIGQTRNDPTAPAGPAPFAAPAQAEALLLSTSGVAEIDALVAGETARWNAGAPYGMPVGVTFSFMEAVPSYYGGTIAGFQPFSEAMKAAARSALARYQAVADIVFVEVADAGAGGQIRFGTSAQEGATSGYAYYPSPNELGGDVWLNAGSAANRDPAEGSYGYLTLLHEIGHALGLKHPGDYGYGGGEPPYLPAEMDTTDVTVMSYITGTITYPTDLRWLDVQAVEFLYGPKTAKTIGILQAGSEAAESLQGGPAGDSLLGRGGDDVLIGGDGDDGVVAGTGFDWVQGDAGYDTLYGNQGRDTVLGGDGADTVFGGQDEDWVDGGTGWDVLYGNMASDTLIGGDGYDTLFGGQGDDAIHGGDQDDALFGNLGNDTLAGGLGSDSFYASPGGGHDVIADFQPGTDWLVVPWDVNGSGIAGAGDVVARAHDTADGLVIDLGGGHTVILLGLTTATFSAWDVAVTA